MKNLIVGFRLFAVLAAGGLSAAVLAAETVAPDVSLSFRGVSEGTIEQGEPLSVAVLLTVPPRSAATIELAPTAGMWTDAVSVELTRAAGATVLARATVVGRPDSPRITLDPQHPAGGLWLFSGAAMQLPPGDYSVNVRLKIDAGTGWQGQTRSSAWLLKVVAPSSAPARVSQRSVAKASEAAAGGKLQEAAAIIDEQLKLTPHDRPLLLLRAVLAEQAGNLAAALLCVNRASRGLSAKGPPPTDLYVLRTRLQAKVLQAPSADAADTPPAWSWPPEILLSSRSEVQAAASKKTPPVSAVAAQASATPTQKPPTNPSLSQAVAQAAAPSVATSVVPPARAGPSPGVIVPVAELDDAKIIADPNGQWAASATASSQYGQLKYAPVQATGAPNIALGMAGDNPDAWCPLNKNNGTEWLEVSFAKPVQATDVRVRQSNCPGAIVKIEAIEPDGASHVWWQGADAYKPTAVREVVWLSIRIPKTEYFVTKVKITLDLAVVTGWKQIDAVQLVSGAP